MLTICMNKMSRVDPDCIFILNLSHKMLNIWFDKNEGREILHMGKSLDTNNHKKLRLEWVIKHNNNIFNKYKYIACLDEKFSYTASGRNKIKVFAIYEGEDDDACNIKRPKIMSWGFPVKSIFLGVAGRPITHHTFTGEILLERVSKSVEVA